MKISLLATVCLMSKIHPGKTLLITNGIKSTEIYICIEKESMYVEYDLSKRVALYIESNLQRILCAN